MKNEILARAVTGIDDALLEDAASAMPKAAGFGWKKWCTAAACLAVIILAAVLVPRFSAGTTVSLYGETLGKAPTLVLAEADPQQIRVLGPSTEVSMHFELKAGRKIDISVSEGALFVLDEGTVIYEGTSYIGGKDLSVDWNLTDMDISRSYEMKINNKILLLEFENELQSWTIHEK